MKILYLVNAADAQSIPYELGVALRDAHPTVKVVAYYRGSAAPNVEDPSCVRLNASRPFDRTAVRRLRALIATEKPEILHLHHFASALAGLTAAFGYVARPKIVKTEHNCHRHAPIHHRMVCPVVFRMSDHVIANSQSTQRSFSQLERISSKWRTSALYNGVDLQRIRSLVAGNTKHERPSIGTVGRLVPQKNHVRLVEAFALARPNLPDGTRLEIVGEGPMRSAILETRARLGLSEHDLQLHGALPREDVYALLGQWHAFVMPSLFEGFCNALVEALAAGLPIACSNTDTLNEVVGDSAQTFEPDQTQAIAAALVKLLDGSQQPHPEAADKYDIASAVETHLALYRSVLDATTSAPPASATLRYRT